MLDFNKIVRGSLDIAQAKALEHSNTQLEPIHLLYGLIKNPASYISKVFSDDLNQVEELIKSLPRSSSKIDFDSIRPSQKFNSWLTQASANATESGRTELTEKDLVKFLANAIPNFHADFSKLDSEDEDNEVPSFLVNLNEKASNGKLDPVIGRSKEIRAVIEILGRRSKNNPILVGPAGVGKTAIIEGLAEAIVKGEVPDVLKGKTIYSLELGSIVAGTKYRGDFEEKIQSLLKFIKQSEGKNIVFIDEIHQIIGAGKTDGAMDAANLLKPALSRGELNCIGATTEDEFQKHILKDPALERRFRPVAVKEPSREDSIEILMGLKEKLEAHHGIKITDETIYNAVVLSQKYITNKNLPDKAIDLIDESASSLKLSAEAMPAELEFMQSEIRNKKILAQVEKSKELEQEVKNLQEKFNESYKIWEKEVIALKEVKEKKNLLEKYKFDLEKAQREQNYEAASELKFSLIPKLEDQIAGTSTSWELNKESIAKIISRQTGIPVKKILKSKQEELLEIESKLKKSVFGQDEALHEIAETLMTSYAGLNDDSRPLASFMLKGPTGVGKTQTAKALAFNLFDSEENLVRIDMSEFSQKHDVAKLIGSPAGYVGYDDGGILTEAIRKRPYAVILFDEIEKAHPDFSDILLQILDDGRLTDNKGRTIDFKNTVVLLTTNSKNLDLDFKPEVIGRLDGVLDYKSLGKEIMYDLVKEQIRLLETRLQDIDVTIDFTPETIDHLAVIGFDEKFGARPLRSTFSKLIIRPISKLVLKGIDKGTRLSIELDAGEIKIKSPLH